MKAFGIRPLTLVFVLFGAAGVSCTDRVADDTSYAESNADADTRSGGESLPPGIPQHEKDVYAGPGTGNEPGPAPGTVGQVGAEGDTGVDDLEGSGEGPEAAEELTDSDVPAQEWGVGSGQEEEGLTAAAKDDRREKGTSKRQRSRSE